MSGPTTGASDPVARTWAASPVAARVVRVLVFTAPIVAGWASVRMLSSSFLRPGGWIGVGVWTVQALAVASGAAAVAGRVAQRWLPLASLLGMSLTFPDQAPSRFNVALRAGTVTKLRARLEELERDGLGADAQEAAIRAVELITLLGRHDRLTRGHTERVRAYAELIAVELGLSEADRQMLAWGVALHDIGKLQVPAEILNKNGRPDEEEWAILARHPAEGARIVAPLAGWLGEWVSAAGQHHERWDGTGYPQGLAGNEISLAGRITAVADAYDVITSRRSYKAPMSTAAARKELVDCAGSQFDPRIVRAMLQASVRPSRRTVGLLSWLPEIPGLASVTQTVTAAPAALATALVVAAPLTGLAPSSPDRLAYTPAPTSISPAPTTPGSDAGTDARPSIAGRPTLPAADPSAAGRPATTGDLTGPETIPEAGATEGDGTASTRSTAPRSAANPGTTSSTATPSTATPSTATPATVTETTAVMAGPPPTTIPPPSTGPVARDDHGSQPQGQTQKQYPVLDNDSPGSAPLDLSTLTIVSGPHHGTAVPWQSTKIRYHADPAQAGTDTIDYRICDLDGLCSQATLTIEITAKT